MLLQSLGQDIRGGEGQLVLALCTHEGCKRNLKHETAADMLPRSAQKVTGPQFNQKRRNLPLTCNTYLTGYNVNKLISGVNTLQNKNLGE